MHWNGASRRLWVRQRRYPEGSRTQKNLPAAQQRRTSPLRGRWRPRGRPGIDEDIAAGDNSIRRQHPQRMNRFLAKDNDGTLSVLTPDGPQRFDAVILAAGAWLPQLLQPLGYTVDVRGQKGQLVVLQNEDNNPQNYPVIMPQGEIDLLPFGHGKTVIGASHENDKGYDLQPDTPLRIRCWYKPSLGFPI